MTPATSSSVSRSVQDYTGGGSYSGDELGITLGSFRLYPSIELNGGYDTNVFAQNASLGTVGSLYTTIVPSLELRSQWLNHQLRVALSAGFGFYQSAPTQNYQNYSAIVDGKLEILQDLYATGSIGYRRATEALGTPNTAFSQAPTVVETTPMSIGLYQRFNRVYYDAQVIVTPYRHRDFSPLTANGLGASARDRTEYEERFRIGYEITDDFSIFFQPVINQRRYLNPSTVANGETRDSDGINFGAGFTQVFSAVNKIEGILGYQTQNSSTGPTSDYTFGLTGSWNGYEPLTLRPNFGRTINESALSNYKNVVNTIVGMDFSYVINSEWTMIGGLSYNIAEYTPVTGVTSSIPRTDRIFRGNLGLLYQLRPNIQIGPVFEYTTGSSTDPTNGPMYDRQVYTLRLVAKQ